MKAVGVSIFLSGVAVLAGAPAHAAVTPVAANATGVESAADDYSPLGTCTDLGVEICGVIYNHSSSNASLRVTNDWIGTPDNWVWVPPGKSSKDVGVVDADGFFIYSDCPGKNAVNTWVTYPGPNWYKVTNIEHTRVIVTC